MAPLVVWQIGTCSLGQTRAKPHSKSGHQDPAPKSRPPRPTLLYPGLWEGADTYPALGLCPCQPLRPEYCTSPVQPVEFNPKVQLPPSASPRLLGIRDGKGKNPSLPISQVEENADGNSPYRVVSAVGEGHRALRAVRGEAPGLGRGGEGRLLRRCPDC